MTNIEPAVKAERRGRLRALALLTAAIALIGGLVPTAPAIAADSPTLIVTIDSTYARFPAVRVVASDGSTLPAVRVDATDPDWIPVSFACIAGQPCEGAPVLGGGGNWTFRASAAGFASSVTVVAIADWVPSSWINPDQSVGMNFPVAGPGAIYTYSFVPQGGGAAITDKTTEHGVTISSDRFIPGVTYEPSFSYSANVLGTGVIAGPHSVQDFYLEIAFGAPIGLSTVYGDGQIALSWEPYAGASGYRVYIDNLDDGTSSSIDTTATSHLWTGLTNGMHYDVHVTTKKDTVESVDSVHLTGIPFTTPLPGVALQAIARDAGGIITVDFPTSPARPSVASDALWQASVDGGAFETVAVDFAGTTIGITGLLNGHDYVLRAKAKNTAGESLTWVVSNSFRPVSAPGSPLLGIPRDADMSASVTATFPDSLEAPAIGQVWEVSTFTDGIADDWVSATPTANADDVFTFTGLTNGAFYSVRVKSTGSTGESAWSESTTFRPYGAAPIPTITSVGRGDGTVSAAASFNSSLAQPSTASEAIWQLKTADGEIISGTDLVMPAEIDGKFVFSGLTNGSAYQIRVRGSNLHGVSDWTTWSDFISPASAPLALPLTPGGMVNGALTVTFPLSTAAAPATTITWQTGTVGDASQMVWTDASPVIDGTTASFPGLTPGVTYAVKATPSNDVGTGPESVSDGQLVIAAPDKPVILIAGAQKTGLIVALQAAATDVSKPTLGYVWEVARLAGPDAGIWEPASASELDDFVIDNGGTNVSVAGGYAITGLINGVRYNLHVAAINGAGRSGWAAWNPVLTPASGITPGTIPAADNATVGGDDTDGDGLPNAADPDVDGDSTANPFDPDIDGDGIANLDDDDRDGDGLINPLDDSPNGIGNASDHADDWVDPVVVASVPTLNGSTGAVPQKSAEQTLGTVSPGTDKSGSDTASTETDVAKTRAELSVRFPYPVGHQARGMAVYSAGRGLMPGSEYTLVLYSTPITLGHGSVNSSGTFQFTATMPTTVAAGNHELVLTAVSTSGKTVTKTLAVRIGKDGVLRPADSTSSGTGHSGSAGLESTQEKESQRTVLIFGSVILWFLLLAAAIWLAIILRRRRENDDDEPENATVDLFDDESVGPR
jgi:hypothetical protein